MDQNKVPLLSAMENFYEEKPAYFRIPGHRFLKGIDPELAGATLAALDLSEAEGLDDLHDAKGVIREAEQLAADLWKAKRTFFLVNGTTCGNEAMVLTAAGEGEKIIVPRNAHKSVLMGLIMSGAEPVYLMPEYCPEFGIFGGVAPKAVEEAFQQAPDAKAVLIVSPTYYGLCSDLETIANICHSHDAALLVDEAHGSHLYFSNLLPKGAILCGADAAAQSIHKTAGSFTQSSLLQIGSDRIDEKKMAASLQMVQSTSPSYLLMASLDAARRGLALHGKEWMERAVWLSEMARKALKEIPGIRVLGEEIAGKYGISAIDATRLVFSASELGISGYRLQKMMYERFRVSLELADEKNVVAVITWANEEEDMQRLCEGVRLLQREHAMEKKDQKVPAASGFHHIPPVQKMTPRKAAFCKKEQISFRDAEGRISAEMIVPYPPGIPVVTPGEIFTREILDELLEYQKNGCAFHGPSDSSLETLFTVKEDPA